MTILPWVLLAAVVVFHFASQQLNHRKRNQLENYVVYLLMSDDIRTEHRRQFQQWISERSVPNALALSMAAHRVVDNMAEQLAIGDPADPATSSTLGANAMLWRFKQASV